MAVTLTNHYPHAPLAALLYVSIMLLSWFPATTAQANEGLNTQAAHTVLEFDIAAQPLETALRQYTATTGLNVLFDMKLISDQHSPGATGSFTAKQALQQLIVHSGLDVQYASLRTFTLIPSVKQPHNPAQPVPPAVLQNSEFVTTFQRSLEKVICHSTLLPDGDYRMLVQIWLSPAGATETVRLVMQTDDAARDEKVLSTLRTLSFPPSSGRMPQPITLLLLPGNISTGCPA